MSLIGIGMNLLLAGLLMAAMVVGLRLNRRLKALKDSHQHFEAAVRDLNMAAARAEQGLADLRAATDEATDLLSDRIEKGRALATKLERLTAAAPALPAAPAPRPQAAAQAGRPQLTREDARARAEDVAAAFAGGTADQRLGALLVAVRTARSRPETLVEPVARMEAVASVEAEPLVGRAPLPGRRVAAIDDDLFEDAPAANVRAGGRW
ncbi:MAG: flagellar positioning protein PflI [Caulobacterales bacterium]|nr:flagellar positioning protein PflI [Caulobacterales bacterium]